MTDGQALHARSVQLTVDAARSISPDQLALPTPCAEWNLAQLLDHMTVQNLGFAAAAAGNGADEAVWATGARRDDPVADYLDSAIAVTGAFATPDVLGRSLTLPELSSEHAFTGEQAIIMHTVDSVVHAWDVARAIGRSISPDPDLVQFTVDIAEQIPDGDDRAAPGAHFAPRVSVAGDVTAVERMLALLGRSPGWSSS